MAAASTGPGRRVAGRLLLGAAALLAAGCAAPSLEAQWVDPQHGPRALAGARVLVTCQAVDPTVRRVCADQLAAQLRAAGAVPVLALDSSEPTAQPPSPMLIDQARAADAAAVLSVAVSPDSTSVGGGPSFSIGIGGFGGGGYRGGGGVGGGVGVSAPVGGATATTGYGASGAINLVPAGRLVWSAKASAPASSDLTQQLQSLAGILVGSARQSGLFAR